MQKNEATHAGVRRCKCVHVFVIMYAIGSRISESEWIFPDSVSRLSFVFWICFGILTGKAAGKSVPGPCLLPPHSLLFAPRFSLTISAKGLFRILASSQERKSK